jgi:Cytochrome C'
MNPTRMTFIIIGVVGLITAAGHLHLSEVAAEAAASPALPLGMPGGASHETLDTRTPLPLTAMMAAHQKQNMRDHLAAIQEIVGALAADDLSAVAKAARRIGYSDAMAQMCQHMGAAAPGFTDMALAFHRTADTIADAAQRGDRQATTAALAATLRTCVGCHASYRQQVVDETTWQRLTTEPDRR